MNSIFNEQILADKLSKLNSTQQCIETLSHWCIFHRDKAELVVTTWDKQFHSSEMAQKVPLLYLANDILQNSKRKGNEFVTEFWKVLPSALKEVHGKGDDRGKTVVSRLVNIWEERRVFGSRTQSLKDIMLGEELPPPLEFGGRKRSRSVKIFKRDSRSIKTKLTVGGTAEKIVSAFHLVISEHSTEDEEMNRCKSTVHHVRKMEKDVDMALTRAKDPKRKTLSNELEEEENILKQCIEKLKVIEANRLALVSQLREALNEQESELENVRTQIQVAEAQAGEASNMRKRLDDEDYVASKPSSITSTPNDNSAKVGQTSKKTAADIAAEVADKLTASSSSQYIMTSVLSSFAAEASKTAGMSNPSSLPPTNNSISKPEKSLSDSNVLMRTQPLNAPPSNPYQSMLVSHPTMHSQMPNSQGQYHSLPNPTSQQYLQPSAGMVSPYGYGALPSVPPPPAPPSYMTTMVPLTQQPLSMVQQQSLTMAHQSPALAQQQQVPLLQQAPPPNYRPLTPIQPPGMVYYAQPHHSQ